VPTISVEEEPVEGGSFISFVEDDDAGDGIAIEGPLAKHSDLKALLSQMPSLPKYTNLCIVQLLITLFY